jgi:hypothetical protein
LDTIAGAARVTVKEVQAAGARVNRDVAGAVPLRLEDIELVGGLGHRESDDQGEYNTEGD